MPIHDTTHIYIYTWIDLDWFGLVESVLLAKHRVQVDVDPDTLALPFKSHSQNQRRSTTRLPRGCNQIVPYIHYKCNNIKVK